MRTQNAAAHDALLPVELAYLGGGPNRVVDTIVVSLIESGSLTLDEHGLIRQQELSCDAGQLSAVELEVWDGFSRTRRLPTTHGIVREGRAMAALRQSLEARQLVRSADEISGLRGRRQLLGAVIAVFGVIAIVWASGVPTAFGWGLLVGGLGFLLWGRWNRRFITPRGRSARRSSIHEARLGSWVVPGSATTTAGLGLRSLPDRDLRDRLLTNPVSGRRESTEDGWRDVMDSVIYWLGDLDWDWDGDGCGCGCG